MITRALLFYVGSILLVVCLVPWNSAAISTPYVSALNAMHIPGAAHIMNAVVLTAVLSALNSGLYASSRMLFALTGRGDAPQGLSKLSRSGVPYRAILLGTLFGYAAVIMSFVSPDTVFAFLVNSYGTVAIFVYVSIAISQLRLRARLEREEPARLKIRMWVYPYFTLLAIAGMLGIVVAMAFIPRSAHTAAVRPRQSRLAAAGFWRTCPLRRKAASRGAGHGAPPLRGVVAAVAGADFRATAEALTIRPSPTMPITIHTAVRR